MIDAWPIPFCAPRLPQRSRGPVPLPHGFAFNQMLLEQFADDLGSGGAAADEAHAAADQPFDRRHTHLGLEALRNHLALFERQQDRPAHGLAPRFAAASASRALE